MLVYIQSFIIGLLGYFDVVIYQYENCDKVAIFDLT